MSLEQALAENTAAINKLIALMEKQPQAKAETPKAETAKAEAPKAEAALTPEVQDAKAVEQDKAPKELTYQDIRAPFLKLVEANEKVALGILSDLGIKSLKAIEGQADKYADVLARIQKAQG